MLRQIRQGQALVPIRFILPVLAVLALAGCAALPTNLETPEVSFVGLRAVEASVFEQRLEVRMKVHNPNDIQLPVNGLDVDIELADEPFATACPRVSSWCRRVARPSLTCS